MLFSTYGVRIFYKLSRISRAVTVKRNRYMSAFPMFETFEPQEHIEYPRLKKGAVLQKSRYKLTLDQRRTSPLNSLPDWHFADGRKRRLEWTEREDRLEQLELAETVVKYLKEINAAKEQYLKRQERIEQERIAYVDLKPKNKGELLA